LSNVYGTLVFDRIWIQSWQLAKLSSIFYVILFDLEKAQYATRYRYRINALYKMYKLALFDSDVALIDVLLLVLDLFILKTGMEVAELVRVLG
jgi:hypothetical protein